MNKILYLFICISITAFSQKKVVKKVDFSSSHIEINAFGLDEVQLENSETNVLEIELYAENALQQHIVYQIDNDIAILKFDLPLPEESKEVFRKYITKRLQRASVKIKVPKKVSISIFGDNISMISKSITNNMLISLEKGELKLGEINSNIDVKMYGGNVFATAKNTNIDVISNLGIIEYDGENYQKTLKDNTGISYPKLTINSIKANIRFP